MKKFVILLICAYLTMTVAPVIAMAAPNDPPPQEQQPGDKKPPQQQQPGNKKPPQQQKPGNNPPPPQQKPGNNPPPKNSKFKPCPYNNCFKKGDHKHNNTWFSGH